LVRITLRLLADILQLAVSMLRPARALAKENLVFFDCVGYRLIESAWRTTAHEHAKAANRPARPAVR